MTETAPFAMTEELLCGGGAGFLRLESVDAAKNRFRFYTFNWQQTLWGEWAVCCTWGRIGSLGRTRVAYLGKRNGVPDTLADLIAHRARRGYVPRPGGSERACGNGSVQAASWGLHDTPRGVWLPPLTTPGRQSDEVLR